MANLTDLIEQYLKSMLADSESGTVDVGRNQLAEFFSCAPSQINYVLGTRFLLEHGYVVETRRGGGGYVRITVLELEPGADWQLLINSIGETISEKKAEAIVDRLRREGVISEREQHLMQSALGREVIAVQDPWGGVIRANILRAYLRTAYRLLP